MKTPSFDGKSVKECAAIYKKHHAPCGHIKWVCRLDLARTLPAASSKGISWWRYRSHNEVKTSRDIPRVQIQVENQEQRSICLQTHSHVEPLAQTPIHVPAQLLLTTILSLIHRFRNIPSHGTTQNTSLSMTEASTSLLTQSSSHFPLLFLSRRIFL